MKWDILFHVGDLVLQALVAWAVIPVAMRVMAVLKDFPPHRHEANGMIRYPSGFEPGRTERL
ncbi:MAG: hypothetical protein ACRD5K_11685 [Candidatus Acidiferrales bacterium]